MSDHSPSVGLPLSGHDRPAAEGRPLQVKADWRSAFSLRNMGVYYALILLIDILSLMTMYLGHPNYLSATNLTNVLYQASLTGIMAVGMTVILISGNFDLSVASVAALAGVILVSFVDSLGFGLAALLAMGAAISVGLINGAIVQFVGVNAFIVTLGTLTAVRGLVLILTDGHSLSAQSPAALTAMANFESGRLDLSIVLLTVGAALLAWGVFAFARAKGHAARARPVALVVAGGALVALTLSAWGNLRVPNPVVYMLGFTAIVWLVLNYTIIGRRLYAVGGNPEAARLSGVNVLRYKLTAFVLCSACAGFAGILFASRLRSINPAGLEGAELTVIAAAILGGTSLFGGAGSVVKTLAGALLLHALANGFNILNLGANYQGLVEGIVVIAATAIYTVGERNKRR